MGRLHWRRPPKSRCIEVPKTIGRHRMSDIAEEREQWRELVAAYMASHYLDNEDVTWPDLCLNVNLLSKSLLRYYTRQGKVIVEPRLLLVFESLSGNWLKVNTDTFEKSMNKLLCCVCVPLTFCFVSIKVYWMYIFYQLGENNQLLYRSGSLWVSTVLNSALNYRMLSPS